MDWLNRIGFNNAKDPDKELEDVQKEMKDMAEGYFDYRIRIKEENTKNKNDLEANDKEEDI